MIGIISGTIPLQGITYLVNAETIRRVNNFGSAILTVSEHCIYLPRHGVNPGKYILPHHINHRANLKALQDLEVTDIISVNSTGSLKSSIPPGTIIVPDDFIMLSPYSPAYSDKSVHIAPLLDANLRKECLRAASNAGVTVTNGGIYWQTTGPRLETKAEIRLMSHYADIVGMTMAGETIIAGEFGLHYAAICSVDNFAHGIIDEELTIERITSQSKVNGIRIQSILETMITERIGSKST